MEETTHLVHLSRARQALVEAKNIPEAKLIRDQAEAIRQYIKLQKGNFEVQNEAAEIKLRAERSIGEMLREVNRSPGGRPNKNSFPEETSYQQALEENNIKPITAYKWQLEADIPEKQFEQFIIETLASSEELTSREALRIALKFRNSQKGEPTSNGVIPEGLFSVIAIDPPWPYGTHYDPFTRRVGADYQSREMSIEELMMLEIPSANDCILWLWVTNAFLHDAFHILDAWCFEPKSILTWFKEKTGVGYWLRGQTEHCLLSVKGKPPITHKAQGTALFGKTRGHSRKPEEFYQLVESLCPGKKLEMFARQKREGWETHGDQRE